jgi:hypothetical protein
MRVEAWPQRWYAEKIVRVLSGRAMFGLRFVSVILTAGSFAVMAAGADGYAAQDKPPVEVVPQTVQSNVQSVALSPIAVLYFLAAERTR